MLSRGNNGISTQENPIATPQKILNDIMKLLFSTQIINKLYHLNTTSFARHKASDAFDDSILSHIDKFAEVYIGRYKVKPQITSLKLETSYLTDDGIKEMLADLKKYLESYNSMFNDSDLLNIRDELLADINKTLYLFNLN
jgi:hypothetical protein